MTNKVITGSGALLLVTPAMAQNTGGVFGPVVNEGHSSFEYRATFDPDSNAFAQRIHYQEALNDDFMWRAVIGSRKTEDSDFDFDFFQAELFWELSDDDDDWKRGLRFDLRFTDEDRPHVFGINWANEYHFNEDWSGRFITLTAVEFGDNTRGGIFFQTRASLMRRVNADLSLGLELYSVYGSTDDFLGASDQTHQLGPVASFSVSENLRVYTNVLFGLNENSEDPQLRLWFTRAF